VEINRHRR